MHLLLLAAALITIGPVDAGGPNRQPQLAASKEMTALVFGNQGSIWFSKSVDGAKTFSAPVKVGTLAALALGRHRGPRVVISGKTIIVSAIGGDGDLEAWRSTDGGVQWTAPVVVDDVPKAAREGLHAMAASRDGTLAAAWLDLRGKGTRLYGAYSKDSGATWSKNVLLYEVAGGTICQCCDPSLAADGNGRFVVMFRNVVDGSRDMHFVRWDVQAQTVSKPQKLGEGSWAINACPMDGGAIGVHDGAMMTAWRRNDTVFLDHPGSREIELGKGKDVAMALTKQGAYVSWTGTDGVEVLSPGGSTPTLTGKQGAFSTLLALPNNTVAAAWEHDGKIEVAAIN